MVEALILEAARIGLQMFFTNMKLSGKSEEEIELIFQKEKELFERNKPEDLKDV